MTTPTTTKERPILFKGEMVRAILSGNKTQTRRIAKMRVCGGHMIEVPADDDAAWVQRVAHNPYGKPKDFLWVRETWAVSNMYDKLAPSAICKDLPKGPGHAPTKVLYPSTDRITEGIKQRPSIFMPRWASRILLEITAVRVERLQSISGHDCWAEGIAHAGWDPERYGSTVECYRDLWESINGPGSWAANPYAWVVEFRRVQP